MKTCTKCGESKPLTEFTKHNQKKDGLHPSCKQCNNASKKLKYAANKESILASQKVYYEANKVKIAARAKVYRAEYADELKVRKAKHYQENREYYLEQGKQYALEHKDEKQAYDRQYNYDHREKKAAQGQAWAERNREKSNLMKKNHKDKTRLIKQSSSLTTLALFDWSNEQPKLCTYCNVDCRGDYHIDHVEPLAKGGEHELGNMTISCPRCNLSKDDKQLIYWLACKQSVKYIKETNGQPT